MYNKNRLDTLRRHRQEKLSSYLRHGAMWERQDAHDAPTASLHALLTSSLSQYDRQKVLRKYAYDDELPPEHCYSVVQKSKSTPSALNKYQKRVGAKTAKNIEHATAEKSSQKLTPEGASIYRALSARCNYLAQDRPDLAYAAKELCRDFSVPTLLSLERLKRMVRYIRGAPRLVYLFAWQDIPKFLTINVDTDFAGCRVTRRSTSGGVAMRGTHCLRHWSSTQSTVALSSGEAELGGIAKGLSQGIGLRSMGADLGISLSLELCTDATAAMGMCRGGVSCPPRASDTFPYQQRRQCTVPGKGRCTSLHPWIGAQCPGSGRW